jgi:hypothetical protein
MGSLSSKVKKIPPVSKKPHIEYDSLEAPNLSLLKSVIAKYPVAVEKPASISSQLQPTSRKMNLSEFTASLDGNSYYSIPKVVQDGQSFKGVWN